MTKESVTQYERIFGIDLGTTNSVIAYTIDLPMIPATAGQDGNRIVPSVVYFGKDETESSGTSARQRAVIEPERVAMLFKRGMGEREFLDRRAAVRGGRGKNLVAGGTVGLGAEEAGR